MYYGGNSYLMYFHQLIFIGGLPLKKNTVLLIAALFLLTGALSAQDLRPAVKSGATSLNFTFGGLGSFGLTGSGVSGGLGMSYFLSSSSALRLGLQAVYSKSTSPYIDNTPNGTDPGTDAKSSETGIGFGVDYLMYMTAMTSRVKPYFGLGASIALNSTSVKPALSNNAGPGTLIETKNGKGTEGTSIGVAGILGAEFFLYSELSLSAEYNLNLVSITSLSDRVISYKERSDVTTKRGSSLQILGFGAGGATLHIYF